MNHFRGKKLFRTFFSSEKNGTFYSYQKKCSILLLRSVFTICQNIITQKQILSLLNHRLKMIKLFKYDLSELNSLNSQMLKSTEDDPFRTKLASYYITEH